MKEILLWKKLKTNREDQQEIAGLEVLQESQHFILRQPSFPKQQFLGHQSRTEFYQIRGREGGGGSKEGTQEGDGGGKLFLKNDTLKNICCLTGGKGFLSASLLVESHIDAQ